MSFTPDLKLPTYEDLECPVVNVSSAALRAGSFHLAKYCDLQFKVSLFVQFVVLKFKSFYLGIHSMSTGESKIMGSENFYKKFFRKNKILENV